MHQTRNEALQVLSDPRVAGYILDAIHDGVMVTDADNRIIAVNRAFTEVTGYRPEEIIGRGPAVLKSGRHGTAFYRTMWRALEETGHWQGDIWDRRKDGEVYLEHLSIAAIRDDAGRVIRHVGVFSDIQKLHAAHEQLKRLAHFDTLTELPNRTLLTERLRQASEHAKRNNQLLALIFMDLDGFKHLNDNFGHAVGNSLLLMVAQRLRQVVRAGDTVARLGGDEFAVIVGGLPNMDELETVANRILTLCAVPCDIEGRQHRLTASLGITVYPFDNADPETLLRHADQAMYQAKQGGRNRYHLFDAEQDQLAFTRRQMRDRLGEALARRELELHYQPKVNLRVGKVIAAEALLRWRHPERGLIPPAEFLPLVEHDDLIIDIGEWVIRTALAQMAEWRAAGLDLPVSVNVAARQLQHADFVDCLHGCLSEYPDLPDGSLELEILESAALDNIAHVREIINTCQRMGVGFALDDFGTGYASLTYLRDIPADVLKIDRSFVRDVLEDADDLILIDGVIGLATAFRRTVVAEGVESAEQGVLLMRLGCDIAQGYGIARPMPAADIPAWVAGYRPDPQWALWADTGWEMVDFPLLVARYDHVRWVRQLVEYVEGAPLRLGEHELIDHHQCRFGHWYYGQGRARYGELEEFAALEPVHIAVHELGPEIARLCAAGQTELARAGIHHLLALKERILDGLAVLQRAVASGRPAPIRDRAR
jgi:diguanylate cyclase (GGDEF)-like protein/PAS domain S-box-containing protein